MIPKNIFLIFGLGLICFSSCKTQHEVLILDTIYESYVSRGGNYLLIGEGKPSMLLKDGELTEFPIQVTGKSNIRSGVSVVQSGNKCYLLNEEFDWDPEKYVHLNLSSLRTEGKDLDFWGNKVAFVRSDSVFVADFNTHKERFIIEKAFVSTINESYILIRRGFLEDCFIYSFKDQKVYKLPKEFVTPDSDHPNFVINSPFEEGVHVLDLELNDVVLPEEGYTECYIFADLLVLYGKGNLIKIYKKNKEIHLDAQIVNVDFRENQNSCFLKTAKGEIIVLNPSLKDVGQLKFDKLLKIPYGSSFSLMKKGNVVQLFDVDFKLVFEGEYDHAFYIYDDRFIVRKNGKVSVVDSNKNIVISDIPKPYKRAQAYAEFGPKLIDIFHSSHILYTYEGEEIVRWENEKGDEYVNGGPLKVGTNTKMFASLSDKQERKINPSGVYKSINNLSLPYKYYLRDKSGIRLTKEYKYIFPVVPSGFFLIQEESRNWGLIKFER